MTDLVRDCLKRDSVDSEKYFLIQSTRYDNLLRNLDALKKKLLTPPQNTQDLR